MAYIADGFICYTLHVHFANEFFCVMKSNLSYLFCSCCDRSACEHARVFLSLFFSLLTTCTMSIVTSAFVVDAVVSICFFLVFPCRFSGDVHAALDLFRTRARTSSISVQLASRASSSLQHQYFGPGPKVRLVRRFFLHNGGENSMPW